ncbi:MAG TPA: GlsB/YeaQ/YmgE family stress response membrane protein, partial [Acidimicrobiales bacterium]|nr:GlsB/YeaQ/YmgE family stress response membrane protein [Acidimicrobiales bacterium]
IGWIVIGVVAGALAGRVVGGRGFGLFRDMLVGLAGAVVGGLILHAMTKRGHTSPSFLVELLVAFAGAVILLILARAFGRGRARGGRTRVGRSF